MKNINEVEKHIAWKKFYKEDSKDFWYDVCHHEKTLFSDIDFIETFKNKISFFLCLQYQKLSEDIIELILTKYVPEEVLKYKGNEKLLHITSCWAVTCQCQKLSEDFMRKYSEHLSWYNISRYQILSEDFIRDFQHKVHWSEISQYQILSENFVREFIELIDMKNFIRTTCFLSEPFILELAEKYSKDIDWSYIKDCYDIEKYSKETQDMINLLGR